MASFQQTWALPILHLVFSATPATSAPAEQEVGRRINEVLVIRQNWVSGQTLSSGNSEPPSSVRLTHGWKIGFSLGSRCLERGVKKDSEAELRPGGKKCWDQLAMSAWMRLRARR